MGIVPPSLAARILDVILAAIAMPVVACSTAGVGLIVCLTGRSIWADLLCVGPCNGPTDMASIVAVLPTVGLFGLIVAFCQLMLASSLFIAKRAPFGFPFSRMRMMGVSVAATVLFVRWSYTIAEAGAETADWRLASPSWSTLVGGCVLVTASLYAGLWASRVIAVGDLHRA